MKKCPWFVVRDIIRKADVVLEVLDARMPDVTRNRGIEGYASNCGKRLIIVINKTDLVSAEAIQHIISNYKNIGCALISSKNRRGVNELASLINSRLKKDNIKDKGNIKVAVVGYPNTGKSSLINALSKGGRARTSPESGFTKGLQLIRGRKGLMLFDTPGVVPFEERDEIRLGLVSGISPSKLNEPELVAYELIKLFKENKPNAIKDAYGVDCLQEPDEILIELGKRMNMLLKGGIVDEKRAAIQLLTDWHKGRIRL